ncbi:mitochondrial ornithine transporter 1-like isoform X2 [Varroa destructor]|uniref:Mitochondrial ornithine transporter 1 n=2 Tax=Varroa destructor TaxID=109461 RepID=A0A7M7JHL4_VARDE|nr:mitochondrial ornithine transporter 1-like isoform X2 [Varroa destructor]
MSEGVKSTTDNPACAVHVLPLDFRMEKVEEYKLVVGTVRNALVDLLAGTLGGIATVLVGQPLDTVKVKMQTFPQLYNNSIFCLKETIRQDGVMRGLYAGTAPAIVANVAENAVLFGAYGLCQKIVKTATGKRNQQDLSSIENAMAGGMASIFSSLTLCPTELVKCKLQALRETSGHKPTLSMMAMCRMIYRTDGLTGFYRGIGATMVREVPGYFAFFGGYEAARQGFAKCYGCAKKDIGIVGTAVSGGVAGICIWLVIFPADLVKSRMQVLDSPDVPKASTWQEICSQKDSTRVHKSEECLWRLEFFKLAGSEVSIVDSYLHW